MFVYITLWYLLFIVLSIHYHSQVIFVITELRNLIPTCPFHHCTTRLMVSVMVDITPFPTKRFASSFLVLRSGIVCLFEGTEVSSQLDEMWTYLLITVWSIIFSMDANIIVCGCYFLFFFYLRSGNIGFVILKLCSVFYLIFF